MPPDSGVIAEVQDVIYVTHHLFFLTEDGYHPGGTLPTATNGLADGSARCVVVHTGIHTGAIALIVQVRESPPENVDHEWDDIVEVGVDIGSTPVRVATVMTAWLRRVEPAAGKRVSRVLNYALLPAAPFGTALGIYGLTKVDKPSH